MFLYKTFRKIIKRNCITTRNVLFVVVDNVIVPNLYNVYAQSNINWPDVDCQSRTLLMHGVPVMALSLLLQHMT